MLQIWLWPTFDTQFAGPHVYTLSTLAEYKALFFSLSIHFGLDLLIQYHPFGQLRADKNFKKLLVRHKLLKGFFQFFQRNL